ncbi:DUF6807 family protein [Botrimarina sp.]|uniref:DUF6807 family protein n=1 Tax=Botrimarina sp. TaxID=2795802 RepID=UPI0032ED1AF4
MTARQQEYLHRFYNTYSARVFAGNADPGQVAKQTFGVAYSAFSLNKSPAEIDQANAALDSYLTGKANFWDSQTGDSAEIDPYWELPTLASLIADPALHRHLTASNEAKAKAFLVNFSEWDDHHDRPSLDAPHRGRIWGSDNHDMHTRSVHWITAQLTKDDPAYVDYVFPGGDTPEQRYGKWTSNLLDYFQTRAGQGQSVEFGSSVYQPTYHKPVFHVAQHAEDPRLKAISREYLDLHFADLAQETIEGIRGGAKVRVPKNRSLDATQERSAQYLWPFVGEPSEGFGVLPDGMHLTRLFGGAATTDYRVRPEIVELITNDEARGSYTYVSNRPGEGVRTVDPEGGLVYSASAGTQSSILRTTRVTPDYALGWFTIDENKTYMAIHNQNQWMGAVTDASPDSRIVVNLTAEVSQFNELQAVGHGDAVLIRKQADGPPGQDPRVYVSSDFVYTQEADGWVFGDDGSGSFFAMRGVLPGGASPFTVEDASGELGTGDYLRFNDEATVVVLQMGRASSYADLAAFKADVRDNALSYQNGAVTYDAGASGQPIVLFDDRRVPQVGGQAVDLTPAKVYDSPYLNADYGSKTVRVGSLDGFSFDLDFRYEPVAPVQSYAVPADSVLAGGVLSPGYREMVGVTAFRSESAEALAYTIDPTGVLQIDFDAFHNVADRLVVDGSLLLGGELRINLIRETPTGPGVYRLLEADSISDSFDTITLPALTEGLFWDTDNLSIDGTIALLQAELSVLGDANTGYGPSNPDDNPHVDPDFRSDLAAISANWGFKGLDEGGNNDVRAMTFEFDALDPGLIESVQVHARVNGLSGYENDNMALDAADNQRRLSSMAGFETDGGWMNLVYKLDPSEFPLLSDGQLNLAFFDDTLVDWVELSWVLAADLSTGVPGDFNNDGVVDAGDYTVWRDNVGAEDESSLNGNGSGSDGVDGADYELWRQNFGATSAELASLLAGVPEPSASVLAALGLLALGDRRRGVRLEAMETMNQPRDAWLGCLHPRTRSQQFGEHELTHTTSIRATIRTAPAAVLACCMSLSSAGQAFADDAGLEPRTDASIEVVVSGDGIDIADRGRPVLRYQLAETSLQGRFPRSNYIHPLYDLDGAVLTEDFPSDHPWHRGVFWTWHQVLIGDKRIGDPWACKNFQWDVSEVESTPQDDGSHLVRVTLHWRSPEWRPAGVMEPFAEETVALRVYPMSDGRQVIDFVIRLLALTPSLGIGGADNAKGYGGFSLRIKNPLDLLFRGEQGAVRADRTAVHAGRWLDIRPRDDGVHNHVMVLTHEDHPGGVTPWILRNHTRAMQNVVYPGRQAVPVSDDPESPLSLRYRLIIHRDEVTTDQIETWQAEYDAGAP